MCLAQFSVLDQGLNLDGSILRVTQKHWLPATTAAQTTWTDPLFGLPQNSVKIEIKIFSLLGCPVDYSCQWNFKYYSVQKQQIWVFNLPPPPFPALKEPLFKAVRCRCQKKEHSCLPFMAQSGYLRYVLRFFRLVFAVIPLEKFLTLE